MSIQRPEHLIIASLEPMNVGDVYECNDELPLHMTVMPLWSTDEQTWLVARRLAGVASHIETPLVIKGENDDWFGPRHDVAVRRVEPTSRLMGAHSLLLRQLVNEMAGEVHCDYIEGKDGYNPHVSYRKDGRGLSKGEVAEVRDLQLIKRDHENMRKTVTGSVKIG